LTQFLRRADHRVDQVSERAGRQTEQRQVRVFLEERLLGIRALRGDLLLVVAQIREQLVQI